MSEELCANSWSACGYKMKNELTSDQVATISAYTDKQVSQLVQDEVSDDQ